MDAQMLLANFATIADAPNGVERLRELVLDLAMSGHLVEQHPDEEPASLLLQQISDKREVSPAGPSEIPPHWKWVSFCDVVDSRLGKMLDKAKNTGPLRPYLRNANVQWFRFDLTDLHSLRLEDKDLEACTVRSGDLIICEGGEPGRVAICDHTVDGMVIQKALHRSRPKPGVNSWYLAYLLRHLAESGRLAEFFTGATIKHLTGRSLAKIPVPLPPQAEQERIVAKVEELMGLCDELETHLRRQKEFQSCLAGSVVATAAR